MQGVAGGKKMIKGIGLDLTDVERIACAVQNQHFLNRVYTSAEQSYCHSRGQGAAQSFAARFAAKEAVLKALGTGLRGGSLLDIEVINDELGAPQVHLSGHWASLAADKGISKIHLSVTHLKELAAAQCVVEGNT